MYLFQKYSGVSSFRQDSSYQKKTVSESEQDRRDWRKRKGFQKDQSKGRCFCKCPLNDARYRRRWERDLIQKGHYDKLYYNKNLFMSSWDCC
jgi:hypothetical protein